MRLIGGLVLWALCHVAAFAADGDVREISWEQWARESCTIAGKLEPECVSKLAAAEAATDPDERYAHRRYAQEIMRRAREAHEAQQCVKRGMPLGFVRVGMTALDVRYCGWGQPERTLSTTTAAGQTLTWLYSGGRALVLRNLKVVAIHE
jgi:hypothetical protein